jgi:hypothetical protein
MNFVVGNGCRLGYAVFTGRHLLFVDRLPSLATFYRVPGWTNGRARQESPMKRRSRVVTAAALVLMASVLVFGIISLYGWGGRIETLLLVFGNRVWVTFEAGRPRLLLLMVVPAVLCWAAFSLSARRADE